jgi:hypothetical protein
MAIYIYIYIYIYIERERERDGKDLGVHTSLKLWSMDLLKEMNHESNVTSKITSKSNIIVILYFKNIFKKIYIFFILN